VPAQSAALQTRISDAAIVYSSVASAARNPAVASGEVVVLRRALVQTARPQSVPLIHRLWPPAIVGLGVGLTAAWTLFLGYEAAALIMLLF
jgi:hypothetical protein